MYRIVAFAWFELLCCKKEYSLKKSAYPPMCHKGLIVSFYRIHSADIIDFYTVNIMKKWIQCQFLFVLGGRYGTIQQVRCHEVNVCRMRSMVRSKSQFSITLSKFPGSSPKAICATALWMRSRICSSLSEFLPRSRRSSSSSDGGVRNMVCACNMY